MPKHLSPALYYIKTWSQRKQHCPGNPDHPLLRFSSKVYGILETLASYILFPAKCYINTAMLCPVTNPKYTSPMFVQISCQIPSIYSANFSHLPFLIPKFPNQSISNCMLLQGTLDQNKVISVQWGRQLPIPQCQNWNKRITDPFDVEIWKSYTYISILARATSLAD